MLLVRPALGFRVWGLGISLEVYVLSRLFLKVLRLGDSNTFLLLSRVIIKILLRGLSAAPRARDQTYDSFYSHES